ncbi:hypothetical protein DV736_g2698, partial [Chaetothyriales sp. CBS 134916]
MAYSPALTSPLGGGARSGYTNANANANANPSPSPPAPQPMSKRDRRRTQHLAHQQDLLDDFSSNRESHYRRQLIALQSDMNLITHADPYAPEPIDDSPEEIARLAEQAASGTPYQSELSSLAGKWYAEFVREVNDAKESKEIALIDVTNTHNQRLERLKHECDFRLHLVAEEAETMTSTLRERLVQQLSSKRQRLVKEKEQLDIADTNALLLHPSQFTITNPASPGGAATSRKTRHTRHRGDQDDLNGYGEAGGKRKRKFVDDDYGSPSRNGASTPAGRRADALAHQVAPLYSIHSLFTDKELNFQSDLSPAESAGEEEADLEAPEMDRTASQNVHVTRSTRTIGGLAGLNILSDLAEKAATRPQLPYATLHSHTSKSGTVLPQPSRLMDTELEEDLLKLAQIESQPRGTVNKKAIDDALKPVSEVRSNLAPDWPVYMDMHLVDIDPRKTAHMR